VKADQKHPPTTQTIAVSPKRARVILGIAVLVAAGGATLACFVARYSWRLELASHFRVQYFWALTAAAVLLAFCRQAKLAVVAAVLAMVNLAIIAPLYIGPAQRAPTGPTLRAMSLNVHYLNHNYGATLELIVIEQPDFVALFEVTPEWLDALDFLTPDYPHQHRLPDDGGGGIALYSRHAIVDLDVHGEEAFAPTIVARVRVPGGPLTLLCTHPASPSSAENAGMRDRQLMQAGELARSTLGAVVLVGDLNTTSWSPTFHDLLRVSGLRDSRRGFGVEASWPSLPLAVLRIPIDHCLVSPSVTILDRRIGPPVGSDHLPVFVDFALAPLPRE
jgi:endonuclease/exonuclease/phosphatase (EEP) superfamily protein YafD